jgi:hypothetical protein
MSGALALRLAPQTPPPLLGDPNNLPVIDDLTPVAAPQAPQADLPVITDLTPVAPQAQADLPVITDLKPVTPVGDQGLVRYTDGSVGTPNAGGLGQPTAPRMRVGSFGPAGGVPTTGAEPLPVVRPVLRPLGDLLAAGATSAGEAEAPPDTSGLAEGDWTSRPPLLQDRPSTITNAPVGATITAPPVAGWMRSLGQLLTGATTGVAEAETPPDTSGIGQTVPALIDEVQRRGLWTPPQTRPEAITNAPVGATVTSPLQLQLHPREGTGIVMSPMPGAAAGAGPQIARGVETAAQAPYAVGTQMLVGQRRTMDAIDAGQQIDPADDPMGYQAMSPEQRTQARTQLDTALSSNLGTLFGSQQYQQGLPLDPSYQAYTEGKIPFSAAPFSIAQEALVPQIPSLLGMGAATALGGPGAGVVVGAAQQGASAFADQLFSQMRADGVDPNDANARLAWVQANGQRLMDTYGTEMGNAVAQNAIMMGPFEAARYLRAPFGTRALTGAGIGALTGAEVGPAVQQAITGRETTPQEKLIGGVTGALFGAAGGVGDRAAAGERPPVRQAVPIPPREVLRGEVPPEPSAAAPAAPEPATPPAVPVPPAGVSGAPGGEAPAISGQTVESAPVPPPPAPVPGEAVASATTMPPEPARIAPETPPLSEPPVQPGTATEPAPASRLVGAETDRVPPPSDTTPPASRPAPTQGELPLETPAGRPVGEAVPSAASVAADTGVAAGVREPVPVRGETPEPAPPTTRASEILDQAGRRIAEQLPSDEVGRMSEMRPGETGLEAQADTATPPPVQQPSVSGQPLKARVPGEQARLDAIVKAIDRTQATVDRLEAQTNLNRSQTRELARAKSALERQTTTRDDLVERAAPPGVKVPGQPKDFREYKLNDGIPAYKQAFEDAGHNPEQAVNYPIAKQNTILREQTQKKFGFESVTIDPKHAPLDVRNHMLDMYAGIQNMTASLGMPHSMGSLDGRLRLHLQPDARGRPFGTYDPVTKTITLTGRANSFAHEWGHALDHHLVEQVAAAPKGLFTTYGRAGKLDPAAPLTQRMAHVLNTMFYDQGALAAEKMKLQADALTVNKQGQPTPKALAAREQLAKIEAGVARQGRFSVPASEYHKMAVQFGDPKYWASELEMFARMNEAYVSRQIENNGGDPRGVSMADAAYRQTHDQRLRETFPKDQELAANYQAFDHLYDGLRTQSLGGSPAGVMAKPGGRSDPAFWARLNTPKTVSAAVMKSLHETVDNMKHWRETWASTSLTDPSRPKAARSWLQGVSATGRQILFSKIANLEAIHHLAPDAAKPHVQAIMDKVGLTPGNQRYVGETFGEQERQRATRWINEATGIMRDAGFNLSRLTEEEQAQLHHFMTTGEESYNGKLIPPRMRVAGGELQDLNAKIFKENEKAGLDIKYAKSGFWPRVYDHIKAYADPQTFIARAKELHGRMFDDDMADKNNDPAHLVERWNDLVKEDQQAAPASLQQGMKEMQRLVREQDRKDLSQAPSALQAQLDALRDTHQDAMKEFISDRAANNWYTRIITGYRGDYDAVGPTGNYLNHRVLPPYADQIMADFLDRNPASALLHYYHASSRKIAYANLFGPDGGVMEEQLRKAAQNGLQGEDAKQIRLLVDSITGTTSNVKNTGISRLSSAIHAGAAISLMPRAVFSMLREPMVASLAHRDVRAGLEGMTNLFGAMLRTADSRTRAELADFLGVTTSAAHDDMMLARSGRDYANTPGVGRFMGNFYRTTGMTQMNNASRRASMGAMNHLLTKYSGDLLSNETGVRADNRRAEARGAFNEFGVPPESAQAFAEWNLARRGDMPSLEMLKDDPMAGVYGLAIRRMVDRSIQAPYKAERPLSAEQSWIGLTTQFLSFNYAFQRNVLDPMMASVGRSYARGAERAELAGGGRIARTASGLTAATTSTAGLASLAASYVAAGVLPEMMRSFLFNREQWDQHMEDGDMADWLWGLSMGRSGLGGTIDPLVQVATHLKYETDLNSLLEGAGVNWYAKNGFDLVSPFLPATPESDTNTRYHNAARAAYNLFAVPAEAYVATRLGAFGAPIRALAGGGLMESTSPGVATRFADWRAGQKGTTLPKEPEPGAPTPDLPNLPSLDDEEKATAKAQASTAAATTGGVPWGVMDDFVMPLAKVAAPAWAAVPKPLKVGLGLGAAAYAASRIDAKMAPFRNAPPPEPK